MHGSFKSWLLALLCAIGIFSSIPVTRGIQKFVYSTIGKEFFTYIVLFILATGLFVAVYFLIFKFKVKKISQYAWLFICTALYVYSTFQLRPYPEEAVHLPEYGLLAYFLFKALSHKIRDWTVYVTALLIVLLIGTADEFLQWMTPKRYWGYGDVGLNALAGGIFLLAAWKGIRPEGISRPVKKFSIKILAAFITFDLIFLGLCLSNTPDSVNRYTSTSKFLSWLRQEEPMTEYGFRHEDAEAGAFYSRMTLNELSEIDRTYGTTYGKMLPDDLKTIDMLEEFTRIYNPNTNPFLYELGIHILRRDSNLEGLLRETGPGRKNRLTDTAYRGNVILEKYFGNTLKHSVHFLPDDKVKELRNIVPLWKGDYIRDAGPKIITSFSLKEAWAATFIALFTVWTSARFLINRLTD